MPIMKRMGNKMNLMKKLGRGREGVIKKQERRGGETKEKQTNIIFFCRNENEN